MSEKKKKKWHLKEDLIRSNRAILSDFCAEKRTIRRLSDAISALDCLLALERLN